MKRVFVDTGGWYAYVRADDPDHKAVAEALQRWEGRLVSSNFVFDETVTLVQARLGHRHALAVGKTLRDAGNVDLIRATSQDEDDAWRFFARHGDKGYSFTDCVSFALMRRIGIEDSVTTDRHFVQAGFRTEPA